MGKIKTVNNFDEFLEWVNSSKDDRHILVPSLSLAIDIAEWVKKQGVYQHDIAQSADKSGYIVSW